MTRTKDILCMLPKYIIIHGFRSSLGQKMPWFWTKTIIFHFSKIHIFGCFKGFWRSNWNSKTSFKVCLITINALPVKKSMKNAFLDYHIFTEYNLTILYLHIIARGLRFLLPSINHVSWTPSAQLRRLINVRVNM